VYIFLQLFALVVHFREPGSETMRTLPRAHYAQAIVMYALMGLSFVLSYLAFGNNSTVTDSAGVVWQTRSIAEAGATVSIYTMIFAAGLSAVKLVQGLTIPRDSSVESLSPVQAELLIEGKAGTKSAEHGLAG
jgi:hypothetical protein